MKSWKKRETPDKGWFSTYTGVRWNWKLQIAHERCVMKQNESLRLWVGGKQSEFRVVHPFGCVALFQSVAGRFACLFDSFSLPFLGGFSSRMWVYVMSLVLLQLLYDVLQGSRTFQLCLTQQVYVPWFRGGGYVRHSTRGGGSFSLLLLVFGFLGITSAFHFLIVPGITFPIKVQCSPVVSLWTGNSGITMCLPNPSFTGWCWSWTVVTGNVQTPLTL